ncbi:cytochrome P450 [Thozetella sp. PMI_491]|nr:cytochrome P450 [Thozetella sp. PMI_491]
MLAPLVAVACALVAVYLFRALQYKRFKQYGNFPQLPPSLLWGHLQTVDEYGRRIPPKAHIDMAFAAMHKDLGRPPVMLVDLRPVASCMVVVGSHTVAEQIVKPTARFPYSPPKVPEIWRQILHLTGPTSIISAGGEEWKSLRKRFNPGFAPQNIMRLLPSILDKISLFADHIDGFARTGEEFPFQKYATDLTFDIIGRVVLDLDMDAQKAQPTEFMRIYRRLIATYAGEALDLPWWCTPGTEWKRYRLGRQVRKMLRAIVHSRHAEAKGKVNSPSILFMSLADVDVLTPELVDVTCDQLSSFLFAGHDTTSTLMSWAFYELSRTPHALRAVRAELDELFGPDSSPAAVRARLLAPGGQELINRMPYSTAVIKETLRLWPPGATSRMPKVGDGYTIRTPEGELCLDGMMVYQISYIIQRDPDSFGETADKFVPERWLDDSDEIPVGAWRPFERGPRGCIGQELATMEARVLMAMLARRFEFTKVGRGAVAVGPSGEPELDSNQQYKVTSELYQVWHLT